MQPTVFIQQRKPGTYTVEVTNIWGCTLSDVVTVINTAIATQNSIDVVSFYPNL